MWDLWRIENSSDSTHFSREKPWERGWRPEFSECDVTDLMRIFGNFICFSVVKYVLDLQCCLHAGEVFVYFVIHKFSLAVVTLQTFYLGKHDLLTVYLGKLDFLSVTDFSLGNLPRGNFIVWVLDMSRKQ